MRMAYKWYSKSMKVTVRNHFDFEIIFLKELFVCTTFSLLLSLKYYFPNWFVTTLFERTSFNSAVTLLCSIILWLICDAVGQVRRLQLVMQNRDAQYKHAVRKKESELTRLKERMHAVLIDSKTDTKLGKYY